MDVFLHKGDQCFGDLKVRKTLGQIDGTVLIGQVGHLGKDGDTGIRQF